MRAPHIPWERDRCADPRTRTTQSSSRRESQACNAIAEQIRREAAERARTDQPAPVVIGPRSPA
ncbi:MAG: hypothetical protein RIQ53_3306 [Pseudomonadota bacterium]|jgi:hypothetical protein